MALCWQLQPHQVPKLPHGQGRGPGGEPDQLDGGVQQELQLQQVPRVQEGISLPGHGAQYDLPRGEEESRRPQAERPQHLPWQQREVGAAGGRAGGWRLPESGPGLQGPHTDLSGLEDELSGGTVQADQTDPHQGRGCSVSGLLRDLLRSTKTQRVLQEDSALLLRCSNIQEARAGEHAELPVPVQRLLDGGQGPAVPVHDVQDVPGQRGQPGAPPLPAVARGQQRRQSLRPVPDQGPQSPADLPPLLHTPLLGGHQGAPALPPRLLQADQHHQVQPPRVQERGAGQLHVPGRGGLLGGVPLPLGGQAAHPGLEGKSAAAGRSHLEISPQRLADRRDIQSYWRGHARD